MRVEYTCFVCKKPNVKFRTTQRKSVKEWKYRNSEGLVVTGKRCALCALRRQRHQRAKNKNASTQKYEKTKQGFLMRSYRNMESRVTGIQKKKAHLYKGKELLSREDFYALGWRSKKFHTLFATWKKSKYDRKLCPSPDRIDSKLGYFISNIRWTTHSENSRRGNESRYASRGNEGRTPPINP